MTIEQHPKQAKQALQSGEKGYPSIFHSSNDVSVIRIKLIQLDLNNISRLSIHTRVQIRWVESAYICFFNDGFIGKVPASYNNRFPRRQAYSAIVVALDLIRPTVIVEIDIFSE